MNKIKYFIYLAIISPSFFGGVMCARAAEPLVTGVTGTLTHGSTITISGSGFGAKIPAAPLKWDDFESGVNGNNIGNGWFTDVGGGSVYPKYVNDQLRPNTNSALSSKQVFVGGGQYGSYLGLTGLSSTKYYISFYKYMTTSGGLSRNYKEMSIRSGPAGYWDYPEVRHDMYPTTEYGHIYTDCSDPPSGADGDDWNGWNFPINSWNRHEYYWEAGDTNTANGNYFFWADGVLKASVVNTIFRPASCTLPSQPWSNIYLNTYFATDTNNASAVIWQDDIYIDTTRARVELGNASTWVVSLHKEIQIPSTWAGTAVTVTLNQGSFTSGTTAYMYVVDSDGNVNINGYPVTLGNTLLPPDTAAPARLKGLRIKSK